MSVVTETSGNGYALYNGVKLLNIDSVWTDKTKYPYAYVAGDVKEGCVVFFTSTQLYESNGYAFASSAGIFTGYILVDGNWHFLFEGLDFDHLDIEANGEVTCQVFWSNAEMLTTDGSVYLAASDPIPLDGMNVITWDGDTSGLDVSNGGYVKLTEYKTAESAFFCVAVDGMFEYLDGFGRMEPTCKGWMILTDGSAAVVAYEEDIVSSSLPTIPSGIWVLDLGVPNATYYIAYTPAAVSGDLRPVYLRENGVWVKKTAYQRQNGAWVLISSADKPAPVYE